MNHVLGEDRSFATRAWLAVAAPVHADASADGRRVVVTSVRAPAGGTDEVTALCVVDVETGAVTAVAGAIDGDRIAVWSPTGDRLAFLTDRTGTTQIAVVDVDVDARAVGDVRVLTHMRTGVVGAVTWSPDGQRLAFTAPRSRMIDRSLPYRIARPVPWADGIGPLDDPLQIWLVELALGVCTQLTNDEWRWSMPRWSPDGRTIAARASHDPSGQRRGMHLRLVTLDGTWTAPAVPGGFAVVPAWSASGSLAVLVAQPEGRTVGSRGQLHVVDGDDVRDLTADVSFGVGGDVYGDSPAVLGDAHDAALVTYGDSAYVRIHDRGRMGVARVSLRDAPEWREIVSGPRCVSPVAVTTGEQLVVAEQSADRWCRLVVLDPNLADAPGRILACSTVHHDPPFTAEVHRFQVPSPADGELLDAWLLRPPRTTGALATVLAIHGGPMAAFGECFSIDAQALCAAGFGVLYTNPHGSTGYGDAFTHSVIGDWGGIPVADVLAVIDHAVASGWVDGDRVAMTGNSYGGYLAAWLACTTDRFRAAVIENPATDLLSMYGTSDIGATFLPAQLAATPTSDVEPYLRWSPMLHAHTCRTPILFVVGAEDRRCPPTQAFELHRALHALGTPSEVLVLPGASHEGSTYGPIPCRLAHDDALVEWMQRWLHP